MTLVIAHRGASAYAPENTLAAFELALAQGADMIELDVLRTADGELVVFHDDTTERWDGRNRPVAGCTLAEMQALDIGGERVPTLADVCAFAQRSGMALNVELKQPDIAAKAAALLHHYQIAERTIVSSFFPAALEGMRQADPQIRRAYLMGNRTYRPDVRFREFWPFFALRKTESQIWHPSHELPLVEQIIPLVRKAGYPVNVWTVDDPETMLRLAVAGATGIITNKPDVGRRVLGKRKLASTSVS